MRQALTLVGVGLVAWWPALVLAEEEVVGGSYRGIAALYFTVIWAVLCYGVYDVFGKKAFYVGAPTLGLLIYLILPSG